MENKITLKLTVHQLNLSSHAGQSLVLKFTQGSHTEMLKLTEGLQVK